MASKSERTNGSTAVLRELQRDCGKPRKVFAHHVRVAQAALGKIIKGLLESGRIRAFVAIPDPEKNGFKSLVWYMVRLQPGADQDAAAEELAKSLFVQEVHHTLEPDADLFVRVCGYTNTHVAEIAAGIFTSVQARTWRGILLYTTAKDTRALPL